MVVRTRCSSSSKVDRFKTTVRGSHVPTSPMYKRVMQPPSYPYYEAAPQCNTQSLLHKAGTRICTATLTRTKRTGMHLQSMHSRNSSIPHNFTAIRKRFRVYRITGTNHLPTFISQTSSMYSRTATRTFRSSITTHAENGRGEICSIECAVIYLRYRE